MLFQTVCRHPGNVASRIDGPYRYRSILPLPAESPGVDSRNGDMRKDESAGVVSRRGHGRTPVGPNRDRVLAGGPVTHPLLVQTPQSFHDIRVFRSQVFQLVDSTTQM